MKKKIKEFSNSIKSFFQRINDKFFFGRYKGTYRYINQKSSIIEYIIKFLFIYVLVGLFLFFLFNNLIYALIIAFVFTIFFLNEVILNAKKISTIKITKNQDGININ